MSATLQAQSAGPFAEARSPLWFGAWPASWGNVVRSLQPDASGVSTAQLLDQADLAWRVDQWPLEAIIGQPDTGRSCRVAVSGHVANARADSGRVLGVVGEGYEPLQNHTALEFADALTDTGRAQWLGAGSTRGGARVFALMRLDREIRIGGASGEDVLPLLMLRNGHDGGLAFSVSVAPFRLACLNGMLLPVKDAVRSWRARHTAGLDGKLLEARRALGVAWRYYDELEQLGETLIQRRMGAGEFERFLARLVPMPDRGADETNGGRRVRHRKRVREAIRNTRVNAPDLADIRDTRWGALQAVAAYVDHTQPVRRSPRRTTQEARFERATEPSQLKDRALELLTEA